VIGRLAIPVVIVVPGRGLSMASQGWLTNQHGVGAELASAPRREQASCSPTMLA
jgi:hypothetical protein